MTLHRHLAPFLSLSHGTQASSYLLLLCYHHINDLQFFWLKKIGSSIGIVHVQLVSNSPVIIPGVPGTITLVLTNIRMHLAICTKSLEHSPAYPILYTLSAWLYPLLIMHRSGVSIWFTWLHRLVWATWPVGYERCLRFPETTDLTYLSGYLEIRHILCKRWPKKSAPGCHLSHTPKS